ncbi:MAG: sulfate ABC transporter substrate-binding protein [Pseudomonadota bacterium]
MKKVWQLPLALLMLCFAGTSFAADEKVELLNASYDVSRELFAQINPAFQAAWLKKHKQQLEIHQSHGGSSKQARSVAEGLAADVVTFNQATDIDFLARSGLVAPDWAKKFPNGASPYYSLPIFLVREGNPKGIKDWDDLARAGIQPVFPNPKTSGNGRYTYLSAYAYALRKFPGDEAKAKALVGQLLANVPVFDTGGRGATTTFVEREIGDVLVTFESEVISIRNEYAKAKLDVVYPSVSVRADFPVAVVDKVVDRRGTRKVATAYLQFLYGNEGQEILAKRYFRVRSTAIAARYQSQFPKVQLTSVEDTFGGWDRVTAEHFGPDGILDQLLAAKR